MRRFIFWLSAAVLSLPQTLIAQGLVSPHSPPKPSQTAFHLPEVELFGTPYKSDQSNGQYPRQPAAAYNSVDHEYLVVWSQGHWGSNAVVIWGRRVSAADGKPIGEKFAVSPEPDPNRIDHIGPFDIAYDPHTNRYLIIWSYDILTADPVDKIMGRFIGGSTGATSGVFDVSGDLQWDVQTMWQVYHYRQIKLLYNNTKKVFVAVWTNDFPIVPGPIRTNQVQLFISTLSAVGRSSAKTTIQVRPKITDLLYGFTFPDPEIAYNSKDNQYLVILPVQAKLIGHLLDGDTFVSSGERELQAAGEVMYGVKTPLIYNPLQNEYFMVKRGSSLAASRYSPQLTLLSNIAINGRYTEHWTKRAIDIADLSPPSAVFLPKKNQYVVAFHGYLPIYHTPKPTEESYLYAQLVSGVDGTLLGKPLSRVTENGGLLNVDTHPHRVILGADRDELLFGAHLTTRWTQTGSILPLVGEIFSPYENDPDLPPPPAATPGTPPVASHPTTLKAGLKKMETTKEFHKFEASCKVENGTTPAAMYARIYFSSNKTLERSADKAGKVKQLKKKPSLTVKIKRVKTMPKYLIAECSPVNPFAGEVAPGLLAVKKVPK